MKKNRRCYSPYQGFANALSSAKQLERFDQPSFRVGDLVMHTDDNAIGLVTYVESKNPSIGDIISVMFGDGMHEEIPIYYLNHI